MQHRIVQREDGSLSYGPASSLILTLPPEITALIFVHCLPDDEFIEPDPSVTPLVLLRICKQWRQIAVATPTLWSSLFIDFEWFHYREAVDVLFCDWISRSGSVPLAIKLHDGYCVPQKPLDLSQFNRFLLYPAHSGKLFPVDGKFPMLRKFIVECQSEAIYDGYPARVLAQASLLREVHFLVASWPELVLPWQSIREYTAERISILQSIDVLREGINLTYCHLSLDSVPTITSLPPITNLQDLTLLERADEHSLLIMDLLRGLTLPNLKHLALKFTDPENRLAADITEFISFARRSSLQLEALTLCLLPSSDADLLRCLECLRSLVTLRLQLPASMDAFIGRLIPDDGFLPQLDSLHLVNFSPSWQHTPRDYTSPDSETMLEMLSARRLGPRLPLSTVHFNHGGSKAIAAFTARLKSDTRYKRCEGLGMELVFGKFSRELRYESWWVDW
ncbi:hypothetical protein FB45DRAFT_1061385 [Roridomyces roridus]|uniref:F-box domain-containing protein n=1 Tax=Roridomyces roridus TaxID=1738132 RepID=A0AAD7BKC0_9AGAR|nr:hypothetical protein FB45DRAFT_1061385 [Roridomyces roridus]